MTFVGEHIQKRTTYSNVKLNQVKTYSENKENESAKQHIESGIMEIQDRMPFSDQTNCPQSPSMVELNDSDESCSPSQLRPTSSSSSRPASAPPPVITQTTCSSRKRPASTPLPQVLSEPSRPSFSGSTSSLGSMFMSEDSSSAKFPRSNHSKSRAWNSTDVLEESFRQANESFSAVTNKFLQYNPSDQDQAFVNMILPVLKSCEGSRKMELREKLLNLVMTYMFPAE